MCNIAIRNIKDALQYVPNKMKTKKLYYDAVRFDNHALKYIPDELKIT